MADRFLPVPDQMAVLTRGIVDLHVKTELEQRLEESRKSGKPLRVKAGFDPTRPDLHVGHSVLLAKMRQFQDCGHQAILLVGEFTAMVGDPTVKSDSRPRLSREEVAASAKTYTDQAFKILDRAGRLSSPSTCERACASGTSSRSTMACGTTTTRRRRC